MSSLSIYLLINIQVISTSWLIEQSCYEHGSIFLDYVVLWVYAQEWELLGHMTAPVFQF